MLYSLKDISYHYASNSVLSKVSFDIPEKDFVCFHGPSGSGKSTLLNLLGFMSDPQKGEFFFSGKDIKSLDEKTKNHIRRFELGFIFQQFHLIPSLSAFENVEFFLARQGKGKKERTILVEEALQQVDLWERRHHRPSELSGGQCQRVAIARALVKRPKVIIGDEPTANLDQHNGQEVIRLLHELKDRHNLSILLASHDKMVIERAERRIQLIDGKIEGAAC